MDFSSITNGSASYWIIFIYGFFTSFHCIGMCGGFILAGNTSGEKSMKVSISYNVGRIISYTVIGFIVGCVGSLFVITGIFKGVLPFISGLFMIIMALNFLGIIKKFKISFLKNNKIINLFFKNKHKNMFYMGLITALLPCGPMQGIQFYALACGSPIKGSIAMFIFSIGTIPVLMLFGLFSNLLNIKFRKAALKLSACLLLVMGVLMINRSLVLFGVNINDAAIFISKDKAITAIVNDKEQVLMTEFNEEKFDTLQLKKGVPVKWIINVDKKYVGDCKASIEIPEYGVKVELKEGRNVISFVPDAKKEVTYSSICGMLSGKIIIYE